MAIKHRKPLPHFCNCERSCPECLQHFWIWAENHTNGRAPKSGAAPRLSFYEAAARKPQAVAS